MKKTPPPRITPAKASPHPKDAPAVLVLAAGEGKRMRSALPKVLHPLWGRPILNRVLDRAAALGDVCVVVGAGADQVRAALPKGVACALQKERLGTGHAVMAARRFLAGRREAVILSGDAPLLTDATLRRLVDEHRASGARATFLSMTLDDPAGYGRVVRRKDGTFLKIVEEADATNAERAVCEVNAGIYVFHAPTLLEGLKKLKRANRQNEYYLTDVVTGLLAAPALDPPEPDPVHVVRTEDASEAHGINSRADLARAHEVLRKRRVRELMESGVTFIAPETAFVAPTVEIGADTLIEPNVMLLGATRIGRNCRVETGCRLEDSTLGDGAIVKAMSVLEGAVMEAGASAGPFARLRPGTVLRRGARVGNFVETKKAILEEGSKANHLTYLGDARVGRHANVGAGTITCNYDGVHKHETDIGEGAFIGSGTQLVAPVKVGRGAYVGAGSTITKDVPPDALALTRAEQRTIEGWAKRKKKAVPRRPARR